VDQSQMTGCGHSADENMTGPTSRNIGCTGSGVAVCSTPIGKASRGSHAHGDLCGVSSCLAGLGAFVCW